MRVGKTRRSGRPGGARSWSSIVGESRVASKGMGLGCGASCRVGGWGKKGLAGVTKGMVVASSTLRLVLPRIHFAPFIPRARPGTLVHRHRTHVLLFDQVQRALVRRHAARTTAKVESGHRGHSASAAATPANLIRRRHGGVESGQIAHHLLVLVLLVGVHRLRMLAQVVQSRKLFATMTRERSFARVFPDARTVRTRISRQDKRTNLMCRARCSLLENTILQSPYPLHWNVLAGAGRYRLPAGPTEPGILGALPLATIVAIVGVI